LGKFTHLCNCLSLSYLFSHRSIIKTQSNLNSVILKEILSTIGIDYSQYELKEKFIDSQLLNIRNTVAHGQDLDLNNTDFEELYREVTNLMVTFKNDVLNGAYLSIYKRKSSSPRFG
jgi:hypothetical protein